MKSRDDSGVRKKSKPGTKKQPRHHNRSDNLANSSIYKNLSVWWKRYEDLDGNPWVIATLGVILGMLIAVLIMLVTLIVMEHQSSKQYPEFERGLFPRELDVNYNEMTTSEILHAEKVLYEVKPQYLIPVKNITFTTNQSLIQRHSEVATEEGRVIGLNIGNGKDVYILYDENTQGLCRLLQHELLHSIVNEVGKDTEEWFVDDMESVNIVYRQSGRVCDFR
tara:strand:- start:488 stop:1153 length:666 start_codon:yes stop_codon:yes gene_type:complete